jgi:septal ring factor EnvC (AmiA/AmiB activator)
MQQSERLPSQPTSGRGTPAQGAAQGAAQGYQSPNRRGARPTQRTGPPPALRVAAPSDLAVRGDSEAIVELAVRAGVGGQSLAELNQARQRIAYLEGALEASGKLESAAQGFAERLEERSAKAREDYQRELASLRTLLDQRERELRTLALEMGKLQGRLEVAEQRLLEARNDGQAATERARNESRAQVEALARAGATAPAPAALLSSNEKRLLLALLLLALLVYAIK